MAPESEHPRAEPHPWPVLTLGGILALQVILLQVAVNRLAWGLYADVFAPAAATAGLGLLSWVLYLQVSRERF